MNLWVGRGVPAIIFLDVYAVSGQERVCFDHFPYFSDVQNVVHKIFYLDLFLFTPFYYCIYLMMNIVH